MSTLFTGKPRVLKAKTARAPFTPREAEKELLIPKVADHYNHFMGAVDEFDHLTAQIAGLRHVEPPEGCG